MTRARKILEAPFRAFSRALIGDLTASSIILQKIGPLFAQPQLPEGYWHAAPAIDLRCKTRKSFAIDADQAEGKEIFQRVCSGLNTQLCWLLVGVFEAYERFLKDELAALISLDPVFFTAKVQRALKTQVRPSSLRDIQLGLRRAIQFGSLDALGVLRSRVTDLSRMELTNGSKRDYRIWPVAIGLLRHRIVHNRARLGDLKTLRKQMVKQTGLKPTALARSEDLRLLEQVVRPDKRSLQIWLLKEQTLTTVPSSADAPFRNLAELLTNHVCLIHALSLARFNEAPWWDGGTGRGPWTGAAGAALRASKRKGKTR